jgi:hypothetical protein
MGYYRQLGHLPRYEDPPLSVPSLRRVWLFRVLMKFYRADLGYQADFHLKFNKFYLMGKRREEAWGGWILALWGGTCANS